MSDDLGLREGSKTMWGYLARIWETVMVVRWVWDELVSTTARTWAKRMVAMIFATIILQLAAPFTVQYIFNGLVSTNLGMVYWGFGGYIVCACCTRLAEYLQMRAREIVVTNTNSDIDQRITELFLEKSMGQHLQESTSLNQANIEKGRAVPGGWLRC